MTTDSLEKIIDLSLDMGAVMLESNSEIYRCEDIVTHVLLAFGIEDINIFTLSTSIFLTATYQNHTISRIKRIYSVETNLSNISDINQLSRDITKEHLSIEESYTRLHSIKNKNIANDLFKSLTISMSCSAFGYMFNTHITIIEILTIFLITFICYYLAKLLKIAKTNLFTSNLIISIWMTLLTVLTYKFNIISSIDRVIIGTIMYLVPGVALTNCVRDMLKGDILSGTVRLVECLIVGLAIASGVLLVLFLNGKVI